jgi:manganese/zinc/iron transport system substrate-binding protein
MLRVMTVAALCAVMPVWSFPALAQPRLLATIGMIADPARMIAGPCVMVEALVGPGLDPHLYTPRPSDIARLRGADMVVALGLGLEGRLGDVLARSGALVLGDGLDPAWLRDDNGAPDPHLWMDAMLWSSIFPQLAGSLTALAPDCADEIATRMRTETGMAQVLDEWVRASMATVPQGARILMTAHDAFGYYADAYGLQALAVQGISTEAEASISDIQRLAGQAAELEIPAVFVETTLNPRAVQSLIEAAAAQGHVMVLGGELYSDALGGPGSGAETWPGMIVANTRAIVTALGGTPLDLPAQLANRTGAVIAD